jgi:uncharacterized membrane protein (DUF485 family)
MAEMAIPIPAGKPVVVSQQAAHEVLQSDEFKRLVALRWTVSMVLLVLLFVTYYGFVLLIAGSKEFMSQKIGEVTTLAIPLGVAVIVIAFALTAFYVVWANKRYDPEVERLKGLLKK